MAVVDVIYDDDNLTIFGPPDQIELSVDIGSFDKIGRANHLFYMIYNNIYPHCF
jgi:hypothetical protein